MELDWIKFLNTTVSEDGIRFKLSPSIEHLGLNFQVYFKLTDSNSYESMTQVYEFAIKVREVKEILFVKIEAFVDQGWTFKISFSEEIKVPANYTSWDNTNEGAEMLQIEFIPRTDTKTYLEDTDSQIEMTWNVLLPSADNGSNQAASAGRRL